MRLTDTIRVRKYTYIVSTRARTPKISSEREEHQSDKLSGARGLVVAGLISGAFWAVLGLIVWVLVA